MRNCMESKFCSHQKLGLAINSISRVVELKLTWDQCPKFTNWVVQLLLVLHFCLFWVHLGPWAGSLTLGPARVCYAMQNVFSHKWDLGNDLGRFQVPTCSLYHEFMIWKRWAIISKYSLVKMHPHSRSRFIIRFYLSWFGSTCEFCIWSLENPFWSIPTLKPWFGCILLMWFLVWTILTPKLGRIVQHHWLVKFCLLCDTVL